MFPTRDANDRMNQAAAQDACLPWAWCNLDRNPFGEWSREDRVKLAVVDLDASLQRASGSFHGASFDHLLPSARIAWQWIGPCGYGKTTRLLAATLRFPGAHYVYVTPERTCDPIPTTSLLLIDEADRLPRRIFDRVTLSGPRLILGTHRCLRAKLRRRGYDVLTSHVAVENDAAGLRRIVQRRLEACRLDRDRPLPALDLADSHRLITRHGANFRQIEDDLYHRVQQQRFGNGTLRFVD